MPDERASSEKSSITVIESVEPQEDAPAPEATTATTAQNRNLLGIGIFRFRFRLANLRPGRGFMERRFSIAEAAALFLAAYLASHVLGLVRQIIFNAIFGAGPAANAYYAAFRLPDTLFSLIAGGALIQAFVPVFISYENEHGQSDTWRLTSLVLNVLLVALTAFVLVTEIAAPYFVSHWLVPGYSPSEQALTITLTRIMLLQPLLLGAGSVAIAVLNSKRQFLLPALSLAVYNVGLIAGLLVALAIPGVGIYGPTAGVVVSAAIQALVLVPGLVRRGATYSFNWNLKDPGLRGVLSLLGPNVMSVAVVSAGLIVETAFTSYLHDKASLSAIHNAHLLFDLPMAFLGQTVGLIALPQLSKLAASSRITTLRTLIMKVVCAAILISIPIAMLLYVAGKPAISLLLQHGAFTKHASSLTALALLGFAVGLPGRVADQLLMRSFYSIKNAIVPLITNILTFALRVGLLIFLLQLLSSKHAILAIPLSVGIAETTEAGVLFLLLFYVFLRKLQRKRETLLLEQDEAADMDAIEVDEF
jgi:putative peptidoglycan lipid II flippase